MLKPSEPDGGEEAGDYSRPRVRSGRSRGRTSKLPACALPADAPPTFFHEGWFGVGLVKRPLEALGWKRSLDNNDEQVKLKWVQNPHRINYCAFREGNQMLKYIPNCLLLTNKLGLLRSLQAYERVMLFTKGRLPSLRMNDFFPETYKLDERPDRLTFLNLYKDGEMWLCKPAGQDGGNGITLLRSRGEIDKILTPCNKQKKNFRPRLIQRYITNPLLLDGRKFDIRNYMVIASTVPFLVLFHKGYVRLSCLKYDGNDTNLTTHLTNQCVQKKAQNFEEMKEDSVWSMEKMNEYINENIASDNGTEQNWVFDTLTKQMQRIMLHCFESVKHKLERRIGYFDFYGFDFMVDTDMKVWLIEINLNPCLEVDNCKVLKDIKQCLVKETLELSIEAFEKSRRNQPLMPMQSLKNCVVLHCGTTTSPNASAKQPRSLSPAKRDSIPERTRKVKNPQPGGRSFSLTRAFPCIDVTTAQVSPYGAGRYTQTTLPSIFHGNGNNTSRQ